MSMNNLPSNEELGKMGEDELIITLIPVAKLIGRYSEDTKQEAILGLIEAVGRLKTIQHGGIKEYLCMCIKGRVRGYIEKLPVVHVPRDKYKEIIGDGESLPELVDTNIDIPNSTTGKFDFLETLMARDFFELIIRAFRGRSLQIILLRLEGKTDEEIGMELGVSQQVIHYQRKLIKEKIREIRG